jgi:hypothetical protein
MEWSGNMDEVGVRRWLISCDESGVHGSPHYGFGSLWMSWQRRGDFWREFEELQEKHQFDQECKWSHASAARQLPFYNELISYFFQRRWLLFHCLVVRKQVVARAVYHKSWDEARRKHYTMLLCNKMKRTLRQHRKRQHEFRIYVDRIPSSYAKADEAMEVISQNVLNQEFKDIAPVTSVRTRDSRDTPPIQLCDFLLGAVMETWHKQALNYTKQSIRDEIARHLGWKKLDSDTRKTERKFNIWYFHDPIRETRKVVTRDVNLLYPY